MKKIASIFLALALIFSLVSCGGGESKKIGGDESEKIKEQMEKYFSEISNDTGVFTAPCGYKFRLSKCNFLKGESKNVLLLCPNLWVDEADINKKYDEMLKYEATSLDEKAKDFEFLGSLAEQFAKDYGDLNLDTFYITFELTYVEESHVYVYDFNKKFLYQDDSTYVKERGEAFDSDDIGLLGELSIDKKDENISDFKEMLRRGFSIVWSDGADSSTGK